MISKYDRIPQGVARYETAEWDRALGSHRVVVRVVQRSAAVLASFPWPSGDAFPQTKHVSRGRR